MILAASAVYREVRALFEKPHPRHSDQNEEQFPKFVLFLKIQIQQEKLVSNSIMSFLISAIRPSD